VELALTLNSNGTLFTVVALALAVLFGVMSGVRTSLFRRQFGRNPWGIHPNLWLAIGFVLGVIGMCLAFLACATTRVEHRFDAPPSPSPAPSPNPYAVGGGWSPGPAQGPPAGWYPDPSGRHQYRFFTGHDWTADVVDNGDHSSEPMPPPPGNPTP
jgi:Protein of unknown function (DUF2510)